MENNIIDENTQIVSTDPERIHKVLIVTFETTKKRYGIEPISRRANQYVDCNRCCSEGIGYS